ncbi:thermonuclease family protein [Tropicimonas sp. IMCC34043]|uniref:thermonuclease family protein n=1 Tax=Tropicimonas sp. IMCC34043 TaxID=2248760 RepID=UPI000E28810D|nr:hypothetical protein [Tropicimonas sp. IMCC34043]
MIDGDTLDIADTRIRLHGIDAPEKEQVCKRADGSPGACGRWAGQTLTGLMAARKLVCEPRDHNRYDRTRISTEKGERWFCSESEAVTAGWRRAYR